MKIWILSLTLILVNFSRSIPIDESDIPDEVIEAIANEVQKLTEESNAQNRFEWPDDVTTVAPIVEEPLLKLDTEKETEPTNLDMTKGIIEFVPKKPSPEITTSVEKLPDKLELDKDYINAYIVNWKNEQNTQSILKPTPVKKPSTESFSELIKKAFQPLKELLTGKPTKVEVKPEDNVFQEFIKVSEPLMELLENFPVREMIKDFKWSQIPDIVRGILGKYTKIGKLLMEFADDIYRVFSPVPGKFFNIFVKEVDENKSIRKCKTKKIYY